MEPKEDFERWQQVFQESVETEALAFLVWLIGLHRGKPFSFDCTVFLGEPDEWGLRKMIMREGLELVRYEVASMGAEAYDKEKLPLVALGSETRYASWVARWMLATRV
jgi:hypothetical protein